MGEAKRRARSSFDLTSGFSGAYRYARILLVRARGVPAAEQRRIIAAVHQESVRTLDSAIDDFLRQPPAGPAVAAKIACRKGCAFCCHTQVEVSIVEAIAIADAITADTTLVENIRATAGKVRGLSALARLQAHVPCPLLRDAACSIYAVRPRSCRALTSYDATACEAEFNAPTLEPAARPTFTWPRYLATALTSGIATACSELNLQSNTVELVAGVDAVLEDETMVSRWLSGAVVFPQSALG
jgi:Fe-S-cluster containining protein